jgi:hypothetical protein
MLQLSNTHVRQLLSITRAVKPFLNPKCNHHSMDRIADRMVVKNWGGLGPYGYVLREDYLVAASFYNVSDPWAGLDNAYFQLRNPSRISSTLGEWLREVPDAELGATLNHDNLASGTLSAGPNKITMSVKDLNNEAHIMNYEANSFKSMLALDSEPATVFMYGALTKDIAELARKARKQHFPMVRVTQREGRYIMTDAQSGTSVVDLGAMDSNDIALFQCFLSAEAVYQVAKRMPAGLLSLKECKSTIGFRATGGSILADAGKYSPDNKLKIDAFIPKCVWR